MTNEFEKAMMGNLSSNQKTRYFPRMDSSLSVCVCDPDCHCVPAEGYPSGIARYDPGTCLSACNGSSSSWIATTPGSCILAPNAKQEPWGVSVKSKPNSTGASRMTTKGNQFQCENY